LAARQSGRHSDARHGGYGESFNAHEMRRTAARKLKTILVTHSGIVRAAYGAGEIRGHERVSIAEIVVELAAVYLGLLTALLRPRESAALGSQADPYGTTPGHVFMKAHGK
jgi:hypothetical protein